MPLVNRVARFGFDGLRAALAEEVHFVFHAIGVVRANGWSAVGHEFGVEGAPKIGGETPGWSDLFSRTTRAAIQVFRRDDPVGVLWFAGGHNGHRPCRR